VLLGFHVALTAQIRERARELGFHLVGIAGAAPFSQAEERYSRWVAEGRHGDMGWFNQDRVRASTHPDELLTGAQSIISLGVSYYAEQPETELDQGPRGRIARYSQGQDYHDVLKARADALAAYIREAGPPETRTRTFVDTAPLLDREAAVQSGLGFYGKNTNLLTGPLGSYLLIGTIITTARLQAESVQPRDCGQCRICLDACPTNAFTAPYELDARRCIAYLTIELREAIPLDLRKGIGDRIFGCDVCQDVCPWNKRLEPRAWPELQPKSQEHVQPALRELLSLDDEGFRAMFRGTAVTRAKRRGLLRNVAVALGNSGDRESVPALTHALRDPEPLVRAHAAWALGQIGGADAEQALQESLKTEDVSSVRTEISDSLGTLHGREPYELPQSDGGSDPRGPR
jgi:epoxyqueuosine reductase